MDAQEVAYLTQLQAERDSERLKSMQLQNQIGQSIFANQGPENLIHYQLDLKEELERIEHILKGHVIKRDIEGNEYWQEAADERLKPFNEYGVQMLMKVLLFYLNRNTLLSNYGEDTIIDKMRYIGHEIADLIFMNYEEMGMDTDEKKRLYPMIVRVMTDTIHSAYLRALGGRENDSLRTARYVTENATPSPMPSYPGASMNYGGMQQRKSAWYKPWTWGG